MKSRIDDRIGELESKRQRINREIDDLRKSRPREHITKSYRFESPAGTFGLQDLIDSRPLILVHSMGASCDYCTMWADGFNGLLSHITNRAAIVITSPDPPDAQSRLATSRGWKFPMYSAELEFIGDMGFTEDTGGLLPGLSVFEKTADAAIQRLARAEFFPGDDYCSVWHLFALLPKGIGDWEPRSSYDVVVQTVNGASI